MKLCIYLGRYTSYINNLMETGKYYYFDSWNKKGRVKTKKIFALTKSDAVLLFKAKYPDLLYDEPYK